MILILFESQDSIAFNQLTINYFRSLICEISSINDEKILIFSRDLQFETYFHRDCRSI